MSRLLLVLGLGFWLAGEQPASALRPGIRLIYEAGGQRSAWLIDSVKLDSAAHCGRVWLRRDTIGEDRSDCISEGALVRWNKRSQQWVEQRPVLPATTRRYPRPGGGWTEFATQAIATDTISGRAYSVVETTVTTFDSSGVARRRLRERYSIALTTATRGVFEAVDSTAPSRWRTTQEFRLVAIE